MSVNVPDQFSKAKRDLHRISTSTEGKRRPLFPYHFFARTLIAAAIVNALIAVPSQPVMAAPPLVRAVPVEKVGDAKYIDDSAKPAPNAVLHLTFAVNSASAEGIGAFVNSLTDRTSANYHKWLTPEQFGEKFGANSSDITTISKYLTGNNFANVKVWKSKLFISGDIPVTKAEQLFGVTLHGYDRTPEQIAAGYTKTYYAPDTDPLIQSSVVGSVKALFGLSNSTRKLPQSKPASVTATGGLDPPVLTTAYDFTALRAAGLLGQGVTIAIFSPTLYDTQDVATFFADENLQSPTINQVLVNGGPYNSVSTTTTATTGTVGTVTTTTGSGATLVITTVVTTFVGTGDYSITTTVTTPDYTGAGEACLDLETIGGQEPDATIEAYEGPNDGSFDILNQIAEDNAVQIVSESWGTEEDTDSQSYADSLANVYAQLAAQGITIFVASGDNGAYDAATGKVSVGTDSANVYVTAVGGTQLAVTASNAWQSEVAWTYTTATGIGSGGGLSIYNSRPSWQTGIGTTNASSNGFREVPDVSALGGFPGYNVYTGGESGTPGFQQIYGTSGSTPLWASAIGLIEQQLGSRLGNINPILYGIAATTPTPYHDITSGSDGVYSCTIGWDFVTGWGSADFGSLLTSFENSSITTTPVATVHSFDPGVQLFTVPYSYAGTTDTMSELLTGLVTPSGANAYDVATWQPLITYYVVSPTPPADVPYPGRAYWGRFKATVGGGLTILGTPVTSSVYGVGLAPGWNMIGNPYLTSEPINNLTFTNGVGTYPFSIAVTNGLLSPNLYGYNGADYQIVTGGAALVPWSGYWIYANTSLELNFPSP